MKILWTRDPQSGDYTAQPVSGISAVIMRANSKAWALTINGRDYERRPTLAAAKEYAEGIIADLAKQQPSGPSAADVQTAIDRLSAELAHPATSAERT